jgi:HEPN domain-containing protein
MPPPERFPPDDPREWLNRARSNLIRAKSKLPGVYLEDLCFDAQQAAEKAIKAIMIRRNVEFPYVHDLGRLLLLLEEAGEPIPEVVRKAEELTRYALVTRYPGIARSISE